MRVQRTEEPASPRPARAEAPKSWSFELRIRPHGDGFGVHLLSSPAGDEVAELVLPPSLGGIDRAVADLCACVRAAGRHLQPPGGAAGSFDGLEADERLRAVGGALFTALFPEPVRRRWDECVAEVAQRPGRALRLVLKSDPTCRATADLHRLPWELLRDPRTGAYLALSRKTQLVRQLALDELPVLDEPKPERRLRVLAVLSLPPGVDGLDLARERRTIDEAVAGRPEIELTVLEDPTFAALTEALRAERFHVLHFMGHGAFDRGSGQGCLLLAGAGGGPERVPAERLAQVARDLDSLRLVVLNACDTGRTPGGGEEPFTGLAHALVRGGVPAVLAMQLPIPDQAAVELSRVFYRRLAAGEAVDEALAEARVAVYAAGGSGAAGAWAVPVLFVRRQALAIFRPPRPEPDPAGESPERPWRRFRRWLPAAALAVLAAAVVALFVVPAPWAGVELQVAASRVAFTLAEPKRLVDHLPLAELAVPDLAALRHPDPAAGAPRVVTREGSGSDLLGFLALQPGGGGLALDEARLPAGTRVEVEWIAPDALRLSLELPGPEALRAEPEVTATAGAGTLLRLVPAASEVLDLGAGGRLVMTPRERRIDLDLTLAEAGAGAFHAPLPIADLQFLEIDEQVKDDATRWTEVEEVSTLASGTVTLEPLGGGEPVEIALDKLQSIAFGGLRGELTGLALGPEGLGVSFRGRADSVTSRRPDGREAELMPTWSRTPWALRLGTAGVALVVLLTLLGQVRSFLPTTRKERFVTRNSRSLTLLALVACLSCLAAEARAQDSKIGLVLVQRGRDDWNAKAVQVASDAFLRTRRFEVLERQALDKVFTEKGLKGFIGDSEGADIAETEGLDWIGLLSYSVEQGRMYQLSVRMIEVKSAEVLHTINSDRETQKSRTLGDRFKATGARMFDREVDETLGEEGTADNFEAAGERLLENLLAAFPAQGYVIQLMGERQVGIDMGTEQGRREGDSLEVFTYGPSIIHPVTGREIRGPEIVQAVLTVVSAEAGLSTCKVKKAEGSFDVGAVVRFTSDGASPGNRLMDKFRLNF